MAERKMQILLNSLNKFIKMHLTVTIQILFILIYILVMVLEAFDYPLVLTPESVDFYVTSGDNTAYFSELYQKQAPGQVFLFDYI